MKDKNAPWLRNPRPEPCPPPDIPPAPCCDDQLPIFARVGRGLKGDSVSAQLTTDADGHIHLEIYEKDEASGEITKVEDEIVDGGRLKYYYNLEPFNDPATFTITWLYDNADEGKSWQWTTPAIPYLWTAEQAGTLQPDNRYGFYDSVLYDPRFMTDGEFDFSKFLDYASQMNVADMLAGRLSDEQNDWMSSGGYGGNIGIAKYLSSFGDSIPIGINPNISDFLDNYISGNLGTFAASDDSENAKTARAYDKASKNGLVTSNDQGEWFLNLDSNEGFDYILNSLIEDTYTNPTLPDSYGYSNPSAGTMNQIAQRLGISDRYDTLPDDYEGEMPYFGEAQAYRNPWKSKTLDDYLRFTMGERFNPAANAAVNNPKLNRRQY